MLTPNEPTGSTRISVARLMRLQAAEELVERAVRAAEFASDLLKAARRERDAAKARVKKLEVIAKADALAFAVLADAPELNMANYDEGQVAELNAASVNAYLIMEQAREAAERAKGGE